MSNSANMQHGVVCSMPHDKFGYFGWPSVARMDDGTLIAGASGLRHTHICPWGKTTLFFSHDDGASWSAPVVIHDSPLDDRDVGVVSLGGEDVLVTWFTLDPRQFEQRFEEKFEADIRCWMRGRLSALDDATCARFSGSWTRISHDGGRTWSAPRPAPVSSTHGPILLKNGDLLYLGKQFPGGMSRPWGQVAAAISHDQGENWEELGICPLPEGFAVDQVHEPHVCEMPDGRLVGHLRVHEPDTNAIWQSESTDGGRSWSEPVRVPVNGTPPHLLRHSSGVLICVYGYRHAPYGQRAIFSLDEGRTWIHDTPLRDDGPDGDLGYPATVEMGDGSLMTVYYQAAAAGEQCGVRYTRWSLPDDLDSRV